MLTHVYTQERTQYTVLTIYGMHVHMYTVLKTKCALV